jgi:hypothetical protein
MVDETYFQLHIPLTEEIILRQMKLTQKHLRLISGLCMFLGAVLTILLKDINLWQWLGVVFIFIGLLLLAPWIKE